jgi:uncharacterized protein DUF4386
MNSTKKVARVAGLLYVLSSIPGFFSLQYVPGKLIVSGNATATANNILASEMLFRLGIVSELFCMAIFIFVVRALYRLLSGVDKRYASLMMTLYVVCVPISFLNVLNEIAALTLLRGADYLRVFDRPQRDALAMLFLNLHGQGIAVAESLWGLWFIPFGLLVMRSGFLPRILGVLLFGVCFGYLADSFTPLLLPSYTTVVSRVAMILTAGELPMMLWLLIRGAKDQPLAAPA